MSLFHSVIRALVFFPSVTFNIMAAEIFPWGILLRLFTFVRLKLSDILILFMLTCGFFLGFTNASISSSISTFASYLNPLLAFIVIANCRPPYFAKILSTLAVLFPVFLCVSVLQLLGVLNIIEPVFDLTIPRGGVEQVGSGRGVSIFSTEPSRASVELIFMYAALTAAGSRFGSVKYGGLFADIIVGLVILGVLKSATGVLFFLVFLMVRRPVLLWPTLVFFFTVFTIMAIESRAISLVYDIIASGSFIDAARYLVSQSGFRILSVVSSYVYGFHNILGLGIGSWQNTAVDSYYLAGFVPSDVSFFRFYYGGVFVPLKPTAYGAIVSLELGMVAVVMLAIYLAVRLKVLSLGYKKSELALITIFFLYVFFIGAVGNPVPWVCAAIVMKLAEVRRC